MTDDEIDGWFERRYEDLAGDLIPILDLDAGLDAITGERAANVVQLDGPSGGLPSEDLGRLAEGVRSVLDLEAGLGEIMGDPGAQAGEGPAEMTARPPSRGQSSRVRSVENEQDARYLISYAHDDAAHVEAVGRFRDLLRERGLDVVLDSDVASERHSWPIWAAREISAARRVLVVGSPRYRARFDETAPHDEGKSVRLEARLILEDVYQDMEAGCRKYVPVLLPGGRVTDIPAIFQPVSVGHYAVSELTPADVGPVVDLLVRDVALTEVEPVRVLRPEHGPTAVFRLHVRGGTPEARDAAANELLSAGAGRASVDFDGDGRTVGALVDAHAVDGVRTLARLARGLEMLASTYGDEAPDMTVGVHVAEQPGPAAVRAAELAVSDIARRMHAVPRARVVVIGSPDMYRSVTTANAFPRASAYRELAADGATVHVAVAGRNICPEVPPRVTSGSDRPDNVAAFVGDGNVVHGMVGNVIRNDGSGPVYVAGRDITIDGERR